jgi:hypothetical protein
VIKRLNEVLTDDELREFCSQPHDHTIWPDHVLRVEVTFDMCAGFIDENDHTAADLSCGNGHIINALPFTTRILGDFAPGYEYTGYVQDTITQIPAVDVFILCETLEHVHDPLALLKAIRGKSKKLVLSTPIGETTSENRQHYWGWDTEGVESLLVEAGWEPRAYRETNPKKGYRFQIWGCVGKED